MSNQTEKIPTWPLTPLVGVGTIGSLLSVLPWVLNSASSSIRNSNPLTEYSEPLAFIGDVLFTIAEASMFSLIAYRLNKLNISKPSPTVLWVYVVISIMCLFGEEFLWVNLAMILMILVTAIVCLGDKDTKSIGVWMLVTMIVSFVYLFIQDGIRISGKGGVKFLLYVLCIPEILMLKACRKYLLTKPHTNEDTYTVTKSWETDSQSEPAAQADPVYDSEQPLGEPDAESESVSFFQAYFLNPYIKRYADFRGYTTRKSFWLTNVTLLIISVGFSGLIMLLCSFGTGGIIAGSVVGGVTGLAFIVPGLALCVRRLRDVGKNPWVILLGLIPVVGSIILLIFFCQASHYKDTEEEGHWGLPDWIVTCACIALLVLGIVLSARAIGGTTSYDLGTYSGDSYCGAVEEDDAYDEDTDGIALEEVYEADDYGYSGGVTTLADIANVIDLEYFSNALEVYRMGSDRKMEQIYHESGSTHTPIQATGMISDHNVILIGWLCEDGKIHGRYHNENGINLDFNGYISPDNSLYIQLGHDSEKSDWYLYPVASELPSNKCRYEGKWGKSGKFSFLTFSQQ